MNITRRQFLKLIAASSVFSISPAFSSKREPYVFKGEVVDYVGYHPGGFTGGQIVREVKEWDGIGYPVNTGTNTYPSTIETYYDFDLADFRREIPDKFWHDPANDKYNNVHTYLREQRFGETIAQAIKHLNFVSTQ